MNCFRGCGLTRFPGFLGDSKGKKFSMLKKVKLRDPGPLTPGSGAVVLIMAGLGLFFFFFVAQVIPTSDTSSGAFSM